MKLKLFSLEEANRLLPVIDSLIKDLQCKLEKMEEHSLQFESRSRIDFDASTPGRMRDTEPEQLEKEVIDVIRLIEQVGCILRDPHEGLIDFPSIRNKQPIYLCWKLGEDTIGFYHTPEDGFRGRKPV